MKLILLPSLCLGLYLLLTSCYAAHADHSAPIPTTLDHHQTSEASEPEAVIVDLSTILRGSSSSEAPRESITLARLPSRLCTLLADVEGGWLWLLFSTLVWLFAWWSRFCTRVGRHRERARQLYRRVYEETDWSHPSAELEQDTAPPQAA